MLEYMSRLADAEPELALYSVVLYAGRGAGANDSGEHQVDAPDGSASLKWKYRVVHLWQMSPDELLALNRPGLLPLFGQTHIVKPTTVMPAVVDRLRRVEDRQLQERLFASLLALTEDEEILAMIEQLSELDELLLDTPYMRRLRERALQEGRIEGRTESRRRDILDTLVWRLNPSVQLYRAIERALDGVEDEAKLERLLASAVRADSIEEMLAMLGEQEILIQVNGASLPPGEAQP